MRRASRSGLPIGDLIRRFCRLATGALFCLGLVGTSISPSVATAANSRMCRSLFQSENSRVQKEFRQTFIEIDGRSVYYEALTAAPGKPTAIVFMGLFTPMSDLQNFRESFIKKSRGEGLIIFAYSTSVESLIFGTVHKSPRQTETEKMDLTDFVREATAVINAESVQGPVTAVGYSYGSAPAARFAQFHHGRVNNLVFAAPLVYPGEHSPQLIVGKEIAESFAALNPFFGSKMIDGLRARAAEDTAEKIVGDFLKRGRFPEFLPSEVVQSSLVRQIRATEEFDLRAEEMTGWPRTHFVLAGKEAPSRLSAQQDVVRAVKANAQKTSQADLVGDVESIGDGAHTILADRPTESAAILLRILRTK